MYLIWWFLKVSLVEDKTQRSEKILFNWMIELEGQLNRAFFVVATKTDVADTCCKTTKYK